MLRGCGLFGYSRRGGDLRKRGEMGGASSRVAPAGFDDESGAARQLTWAEVEAATGGFSSRVIGHGGFSTVYLASYFPSGGRVGAVKVHCSSERLHRAFRQELDVLLSLRHPHIVRLLAYCDVDDEGALVFEYAPNGDLHHKLHSGDGGDALPWSRRVAVAFQLAQALEHLHEARAVVHGDVKSSNVLLDAAMDAKLCDFGSARRVDAATAATKQRGGAGRHAVVGSPGYVDPQVLRSGVATRGSDVYSFGVLLLELLTGNEAVCRETGHRLTATVGQQLRDAKVSDVVDSRLGDKYDAAEAAAVAELAARCVSDSPGLRPSMADVVRVLREKTAVVGSKSDRK
ncbi:hypothetical protein PR202_gb14823 [Eleusine coracana subsp. coracana]|uniref:Protein kinase domain-containing protein n=1 Tax=Eleusine coracana subsp. coracana TaxID=191504 RepID=A0AAV5EX96_ELECO|nr:hypothetical protein QOZ80_4BG0339950 [Eleusine coracana subsp. coracana]GJN26860.1 hypothetical protein PR202_gb14823 [Eleusine coracana subsp. coracana]